jgi:hypothetical protein
MWQHQFLVRIGRSLPHKCNLPPDPGPGTRRGSGKNPSACAGISHQCPILRSSSIRQDTMPLAYKSATSLLMKRIPLRACGRSPPGQAEKIAGLRQCPVIPTYRTLWLTAFTEGSNIGERSTRERSSSEASKVQLAHPDIGIVQDKLDPKPT